MDETASSPLIRLTWELDPEVSQFKTLLDKEFGADEDWFLSKELIPQFVDRTQNIVINRDYIENKAKFAGLSGKELTFALFYVCAHERAHAWQYRTCESNGIDFRHAYDLNPRLYELEADFIAGFLHMLHILLAIGEHASAEYGDVVFSAYVGVHTDSLDALTRLCEADANPSTHGTGEQRMLAFRFGARLFASNIRAKRTTQQAWAACCEKARGIAMDLLAVGDTNC